MSRIGKQPIILPKQVVVYVYKQKIYVNGPKGGLSRILPPSVRCRRNRKEGKLYIIITQDTKFSQALYGLIRTLVSNMVIGVSEGFEKRLQIIGIGYRAQLEGKTIILNMGYSCSVQMLIPSSLSVKCETPTNIVVSGTEKDLVGQFAAKIRSVRPPEPYKGKGIAYEGEVIRRKAGKTSK